MTDAKQIQIEELARRRVDVVLRLRKKKRAWPGYPSSWEPIERQLADIDAEIAALSEHAQGPEGS